VLGPLGQVHAAEGHANGARGDEHDAVAIGEQLDGGLDNDGEDGEQRLVRVFGDDGAGAWQR